MAGTVKDVTVRINVEDKSIKDAKKSFDKLNNEINQQEGLLGKLAKKEQALIELRRRSSDPKAIKNFNRELDKTRKEMDKLTNSTKKTSTTFSKMKDSIIGIGVGLASVAAAQAIIGDAIKRIRDFQQAIANLSAITGKTGEDLEELKKKVIEVSAATGKGAADVAKAFQIVGSAAPELLKSSSALAEVTEQAIILSKAGGLEVPEAAAALTKAMNQFGASASDAQKFTDILATSQQKGTATISQLSEAMKNAGANANAAGLSFEETNVALQALAKGGLVGSEAGTGLSAVLVKLSKQSDDSINPSLTSLSEVVENLSKRNLNLKDAVKLVEAESAKTLLTLVGQKEVVNELTGSLNEVGNASEQAATIFQTVDGQLEALDSSYERFILSIEDGDGVLSQLTSKVIGYFDEILVGLTEINDFEFDRIFDPESTESFGAALFELGSSISGLVNPNMKAMADIMKKDVKKAVGETTEAVEDLNVAIDSNTESTGENETTSEESAAERKKRLDKLRKESKARLAQAKADAKEAAEVAAADQAEDDAFLEQFGLTDEQLEKKKLQKEKALNLDFEAKEAELEQTAVQNEKDFIITKKITDSKKQLNTELALSALGLAATLAQAAGDSQAAQLLGLVFQKAAAVTQAIISTNLAAAAAVAPPPIGAGPVKGLALAGLIKATGAVNVAAIIGTAIPQLQQIGKSKEPQKFKDGGILIQGPGTETSDSIPALLSKNESVIKAKQSKKHAPALKAINNDKFDEYLDRVVAQKLMYKDAKKEVNKAMTSKMDLNFPDRMAIKNTRAISKPIVDAIQEQNFLKGAGWQ